MTDPLVDVSPPSEETGGPGGPLSRRVRSAGHRRPTLTGCLSGLFRIEPIGRFPTPWSGKGCGWLGLGAWSGWWARRTPLHPGAGEPVIEPGGGVDVTDDAP